VVTLEQAGVALSDNYLKIELAAPREPNCLCDIEIGGVTAAGLRERTALAVLG
jgi:hypothetical protein